MKKILLILCLSLFLCGCSNTSDNEELEKLMAENE